MDLATLVPVLNRPQNVEPLVASWELSQTPGVLVFIVEVDDNDERIALEAVAHRRGVKVLPVMSAHTWPQKINTGVANVTADWYLCAADDVEFQRGWWQATVELRSDPTVGVIGTNDSLTGRGNPAVAEGQHTCHPLIRRTYIEQRGIWGQRGLAVCEEYHHWYVDNELVVTAKLRDAWAFCREAVLHHKHPYWEGGTLDATYLLGEANADVDRMTWERRAVEYGPLIAGNPN